MLKIFWQGLERGARIGLILGVGIIVAATVTAATWLLRTDYQVLFANLTPQDAGAMAAELDRMKIPYKLGDDGASILVDKDTVHNTRIKLMSKDLPLHGTVGFELFNNADFGMTEFAQKVNYQRALQGEITRTILSLSEIEAARVHLALPEEGLFKRANASNKPKASITLTMKRGQTLRLEQVAGIQRLVSAAAPGIATQDVTIIDQHGVALTRAAQGESGLDVTSLRLDLKKETEQYLNRKVDAVLERAFGAGEAMASVDVTLNMDQVRITTEDPIGTPGKGEQASTGVVVKERETIRDGVALPDVKSTDGASRGNSSVQREVEYQAGRRVEQVVSSPGSVRQIHVVAVVRKVLDPVQLEQARDLVAAAAGASRDRGDTVVVQTLPAVSAIPATPAIPAIPAVSAIPSTSVSDNIPSEQGAPLTSLIVVLALLLAVSAGIGLGMLLRRPKQVQLQAALTDSERQAVLRQIKGWVAQPVGLEANDIMRGRS